jgi:hypothetical protein
VAPDVPDAAAGGESAPFAGVFFFQENFID